MNAESFKKKFLPCHQKLYRIAFRIIQDKATAQDIVQDVYTKLWEIRAELSGLNNSEAFAITVLKNLCLDYIRRSKNKRSSEFNPNVQSEENMTTTDIFEVRNEADFIKKLISRLPEQQKQILMFKDWDGYTNEEIEIITGLSANNVRVTLSRARKTVREQYLKLYAK